jgi:hypothetical protein
MTFKRLTAAAALAFLALRGLCAGRGRGGNAEHGCVSRTEAILHAESSAQS